MNIVMDAEHWLNTAFSIYILSSVEHVSPVGTRGQYKIETSEHFIRIQQTPHPCLQNDKQNNSNDLTEMR